MEAAVGPGFTTLQIGSTKKWDCTCVQGEFWNRKTHECSKCKEGSFCAGGPHLPVVYEKNYGKAFGNIDGTEIKTQDDALGAGTYNKGDYTDAFSDYWVLACESKDVCPGGSKTFKAVDDSE